MVRCLAPLSLLFFLTACGLSPVYGKGAANAKPGLRAALEATQVQQAEGTRVAQLLSIAMEDELHPQGPTGASRRFLIRMDPPRVEEIAIAVENNQFVARTNLRVTARVHIVRLSDQRELSYFTARRLSSFNTSISSDFSTVVARDDALKRGAKELAADIAMRTQALLARETEAPAPLLTAADAAAQRARQASEPPPEDIPMMGVTNPNGGYPGILR